MAFIHQLANPGYVRQRDAGQPTAAIQSVTGEAYGSGSLPTVTVDYSPITPGPKAIRPELIPLKGNVVRPELLGHSSSSADEDTPPYIQYPDEENVYILRVVATSQRYTTVSDPTYKPYVGCPPNTIEYVWAPGYYVGCLYAGGLKPAAAPLAYAKISDSVEYNGNYTYLVCRAEQPLGVAPSVIPEKNPNPDSPQPHDPLDNNLFHGVIHIGHTLFDQGTSLGYNSVGRFDATRLRCGSAVYAGLTTVGGKAILNPCKVSGDITFDPIRIRPQPYTSRGIVSRHTRVCYGVSDCDLFMDFYDTFPWDISIAREPGEMATNSSYGGVIVRWNNLRNLTATIKGVYGSWKLVACPVELVMENSLFLGMRLPDIRDGYITLCTGLAGNGEEFTVAAADVLNVGDYYAIGLISGSDCNFRAVRKDISVYSPLPLLFSYPTAKRRLTHIPAYIYKRTTGGLCDATTLTGDPYYQILLPDFPCSCGRGVEQEYLETFFLPIDVGSSEYDLIPVSGSLSLYGAPMSLSDFLPSYNYWDDVNFSLHDTNQYVPIDDVDCDGVPYILPDSIVDEPFYDNLGSSLNEAVWGNDFLSGQQPLEMSWINELGVGDVIYVIQVNDPDICGGTFEEPCAEPDDYCKTKAYKFEVTGKTTYMGDTFPNSFGIADSYDEAIGVPYAVLSFVPIGPMSAAEVAKVLQGSGGCSPSGCFVVYADSQRFTFDQSLILAIEHQDGMDDDATATLHFDAAPPPWDMYYDGKVVKGEPISVL